MVRLEVHLSSLTEKDLKVLKLMTSKALLVQMLMNDQSHNSHLSHCCPESRKKLIFSIK